MLPLLGSSCLLGPHGLNVESTKDDVKQAASSSLRQFTNFVYVLYLANHFLYFYIFLCFIFSKSKKIISMEGLNCFVFSDRKEEVPLLFTSEQENAGEMELFHININTQSLIQKTLPLQIPDIKGGDGTL